MVKKIIFFVLFFYILTLIQVSFLTHFSLFGITLNLILIAIILINFFEKPEKKLGIISSFFGGFYLDIFSLNSEFFGFYTLISVALALFIKFFLKKHVRIPIIKRI